MKKGFTLAEALLTLTIIGVVAAMTIPSLTADYENQQFTSSLQKGLNSLNNAIQTSIATNGESPLESSDLAAYLARHMSIYKSTNMIGQTGVQNNNANAILYTADGMRIEIPKSNDALGAVPYHENNATNLNTGSSFNADLNIAAHCGSAIVGRAERRTRASRKNPCVIIIDVNGDKAPNSYDVNDGSSPTTYGVSKPGDKLLRDVYTILITDKEAIPYGVVAQKALYGKANNGENN